ncbi:MAG: PD-(D/E)XK nuclease family protein [Candidatus Pacearchaeota archaeon]|jgi:RecB family exonuclease
MTVYSHSRLSTFEQCKLKYKFKYIDKLTPDFEKSIEAHLGTCVHDTLEWLYSNVLNDFIPELDRIIEFYTNKWQEDYKENFKVVRKDAKPEDYFSKGIKFLVDYYLKNSPFQDGTIDVEKEVYIILDETSPHKIKGFIDRLVFNKEKNRYEVHDYKTASSLPNPNKFENDRQLALYSLAIKQTYGYDKEIILIWHYLDHNKRIESKRTNEQLENLRKQTIELIEKIEKTKEFPPEPSALCDWCEYRDQCPYWKGR